MAIERLQTGGDCRDGRDIAKINELIDQVNALCTYTVSHDRLLGVKVTGAGVNIDCQGLVQLFRALGVNIEQIG